MSTVTPTIIFSHGKESGPWGSKILAMAAVAREAGLAVESVDYQGIDDPHARVQKLLQTAAGVHTPLILAGSSMGGHVSAAAATPLRAVGLFLLAPAFYMPGLEEHTPQDVTCATAIVHGWNDDIVPVQNSIRWAREHHAALHVLDSDHRLQDQIPAITSLLGEFLKYVR
jgi:pimeloyl-ACP methyl ester carboxylesterase